METQWQKLKDLFEQAITLSGTAQQEFLAGVRRDHPELAEQLQYLLNQHAAAGRFLGGDSTCRSVLSAEQLVAGRYKVVRQLGRGGMGEVYEAIDLQLNETIALKTVRHDVLDSAASKRLIQELQLARKVTHPNVCRVYDVGWHSDGGEDIVFLTMEFVQGETLASRLSRERRLALEAALEIARQIARAIDAAHAGGIVHGDLKPSNIMLGPADHVVITDFGLARSKDHTITLTLEGQIMGTPAYMAPEQVSGGRPTASSDIYALGVILHELITGVRPADMGVRPDLTVPVEWRTAMQRALHPDPKQRFATGGQFIAALGVLPAKPVVPRRVFITAAGLSVIGLSIAFEEWLRLAGSTIVSGYERLFGGPAAPIHLMVGDVVDSSTSTGPADHSLAIALRTYLEQSQEIRLLPWSKVRSGMAATGAEDGWLDLERSSALAQREAIEHVLAGEITFVEPHYMIALKIVNSRAPQNVVRTEFALLKSKDELLPTLGELARKIRVHIGESARSRREHDTPLENVTSSSLLALSEYYAGYDQQLRGNMEAAIEKYKAAVAKDSDFALAYARMGICYTNFEDRLHAQQSLEKSLSLLHRVTEPERLLILGLYHLNTFDYVSSLQHLRALTDAYPENYSGHLYSGVCYMLDYQLPLAEASIRRAADIEPTAFALSYLVTLTFANSKFKEAETLLNGAAAGLPETYRRQRLVSIYGAQNRFSEAERQIGALQAGDRTAQSEAVDGQIKVMLLRGRISDCLRILESAGPTSFKRRLVAAELNYLVGRPNEAKAHLRAASTGNVSEINRALLIAHWSLLEDAAGVASETKLLYQQLPARGSQQETLRLYADGIRYVVDGDSTRGILMVMQALDRWNDCACYLIMLPRLEESLKWELLGKVCENVRQRFAEILWWWYPLPLFLTVDYYRAQALGNTGRASEGRQLLAEFLSRFSEEPLPLIQRAKSLAM